MPKPSQATAGDPAHNRIAAIIAAISGLVTGPPTLVGFDFADLRAGLTEGGSAVFGQSPAPAQAGGEASGPDRAVRAADAALAQIREQLRGQ